MNVDDLPEHVRANRSYWDGMADEWVEPGERNWARSEPAWGIWASPESTVRLLPTDMSGMRTIELGCGTGYVSAWMNRRGAHTVGVDNSAAQLETASRLAREYGVDLELIHGNAETLPASDASFDFAISEYGAAIWCDPHAWIPEAFRVLKPGSQLVFLGTHPLALVATPLDGSPCEAVLHRPYKGLHTMDWRSVEVDPGGIEFNLPIAEWFRLFLATGFVVEDYIELYAPAGESQDRFSIPAEWAKQWPGEQIWKLRKPIS